MFTSTKIAEAAKRIEAKGFTIELAAAKAGYSENMGCGRSSSVTVQRFTGIIEFSANDGEIWGRVDVTGTQQTFVKRNPNDRAPKSMGESAVFTADAATKKLLDWR